MKAAHCCELRELLKQLTSLIQKYPKATLPTYQSEESVQCSGAHSLFWWAFAALPCQQNGQEWSRNEAGRKQFYDGERVSEKRGTISQPGHSTFYGLGGLLAYYVKRHCTGQTRICDTTEPNTRILEGKMVVRTMH